MHVNVRSDIHRRLVCTNCTTSHHYVGYRPPPPGPSPLPVSSLTSLVSCSTARFISNFWPSLSRRLGARHAEQPHAPPVAVGRFVRWRCRQRWKPSHVTNGGDRKQPISANTSSRRRSLQISPPSSFGPRRASPADVSARCSPAIFQVVILVTPNDPPKPDRLSAVLSGQADCTGRDGLRRPAAVVGPTTDRQGHRWFWFSARRSPVKPTPTATRWQSECSDGANTANWPALSTSITILSIFREQKADRCRYLGFPWLVVVVATSASLGSVLFYF